MSAEQDSDDLRVAFAERELGRQAPEDAPNAEELWAVATGDADAEQGRRVAAAVARSPEVAAEWRATVALVEEGREAGALPDHQRAPAEVESSEPHRLRRPAVWALAIAAAALLTLALWPPSGPPEDGGATDYRALPQVELDVDVNFTENGGVTLEWSGHPEHAQFDVVVQDSALRVLTESVGQSEPTLRLDAHSLAQRSGDTIYWTVTVITTDGDRRRSPTFSFTLNQR